MIEAGKKSQLVWSPDCWVFLDIGFANNKASCGLLFGDEQPRNVRFGEARKYILQKIRSSPAVTNLVIEAPLSICFDSHGNPKGRRIEAEGGKTRYWYCGLGCAVMVAAMYLVRDIQDQRLAVRLFEGFISFKQGARSDHSRDVCVLRHVVKNASEFSQCIVASDELKLDSTDELRSAFHVSGMDCGIPTVIKTRASEFLGSTFGY